MTCDAFQFKYTKCTSVCMLVHFLLIVKVFAFFYILKDLTCCGALAAPENESFTLREVRG